jgi:hypothetical protein
MDTFRSVKPIHPPLRPSGIAPRFRIRICGGSHFVAQSKIARAMSGPIAEYICVIRSSIGIPSVPFHLYDCMTLFFDMAADRSSVRQKDDRQIVLGVRDTVYGNTVFPDGEHLANLSFLTDAKYVIHRQGTLNDNRDVDTGYVIEAAFSWKDFGKKPKMGDSLGFDVFNTDNDFGQPWRIGKGFSGTEVSTNNNPSEWGTWF